MNKIMVLKGGSPAIHKLGFTCMILDARLLSIS